MIAPSHDYRRTAFRVPPRACKGIDAAVYGVIGRYRRRNGILRTLRAEAALIESMAGDFEVLNDAQLREKLRGFRDHFRRGGKHRDEALPAALAGLREAVFRCLGLRPFAVQLMGALALFRGRLAEMATGEGKTLTAGLAAALFGWMGKPCHLITVNDYLVQRDAEWLTGFYDFAGVRAGFVTASMTPAERRQGYACDVTYGTSKEIVADFLRDSLHARNLRNPTRRLIRRMLSPELALDGLVMRGLHTVIVDEADSVLVDEAVTPLILSSPQKNEPLQQVVAWAQKIAEPLKPDLDYVVHPRFRDIEFTEEGLEKLDEWSSTAPALWGGPARRCEWVRQALSAREFFQEGKQYVIADGRIVIVDEFTGRPMPQRTWRQGLHQAVEAKEGLEISDPAETLARLSFQRYFRFYHHLAGMSGTASEAASEFWQTYQLPVTAIPTNRPCIRIEYPDRAFATEAAKWSAIVEEIVRVHQTGRPVLIGTRNVAASELLAEQLRGRGLVFQLLNAVRIREEAEIIANAGQGGRITIATNMAGRGTDIRLGPGVAELGGLHVLSTERHESPRVDRQLFGRSSRQGDPGSAQAFISLEDELFRRHLPAALRRWFQNSIGEGSSNGGTLAKMAVAWAQQAAQKHAFAQRRSVLKTDDWLEESLSFAGGEI